VGVDDRVVVRVDDAGARSMGGGGLVHVRGRGGAGADVQELGHSFFFGQVGHRAAQETTVGPGP